MNNLNKKLKIIVEIYQKETKVKTITSDVNSVINNAWNYFGFSWYLEKRTSDNNPLLNLF